ncbi:MAG: hypothetical protein H0Z33_15765 [Bacillaceae bacterium]|nr:hypothetical protein [Bacillaceae bacterium]
MQKIKLGLLLLIVTLIFTGCGLSSDKKDPSTENAQYHNSFPEVVKLTYENVEFEPLDDHVSIMNWEKQKSIPFGEISGESIDIDLYSNKDDSSNFIGLLHFNNQSYLIRPIGYSHDIESIKTYIINTKYTDFEKGLHVIGAIGSPALGYQYVFYDDTNEEWLVYHNWGIPTVIDVNKDGNDELLLQFQGMGNHFPDISVLSRNNVNSFQVTTINDNFIDLMEIDPSLNRISSTLNSDAETLEVELMGEEHESKKYKFDTLETLILVSD